MSSNGSSGRSYPTWPKCSSRKPSARSRKASSRHINKCTINKNGDVDASEAYHWSSIDIELFGEQLQVAYRAEWVGEQLTDTQRVLLEAKGVKVERLDRARASVLIAALHERQAQGLCTYKQARLLSRHGVKTEQLKFDVARKLIDSLAAQGWRPRPGWQAWAQRTVAEGAP